MLARPKLGGGRFGTTLAREGIDRIRDMTQRPETRAHFDAAQVIRQARATLDIEAAAVLGLKSRIGDSFARTVQRILLLSGRVVVMGMGKSGHIGRKIAATLASTGTPAMFVHPAEAGHGDLGMVTAHDLVLAISNSGESEELNLIIPVLKRQGVALVAITGGLRSTLAQHADETLDSGVDKEACPLNLTPTASSTAQLALGDALAVALLEVRGFKAEDFARSHPGGALGRKLLTHVGDVMRTGADIPSVGPGTPFGAMMREMSAKGGVTAIVDDEQRVLGVFTDGDLRRLVEKGADLRQTDAQSVMHPHPRTIRAEALAVEAAEMMELHRITSVLVVDAAGALVGVVHVGDLMRAKVI